MNSIGTVKTARTKHRMSRKQKRNTARDSCYGGDSETQICVEPSEIF